MLQSGTAHALTWSCAFSLCQHAANQQYMQTMLGNLKTLACVQFQESFLDEGFILDKRIGVGQPKRILDAKILVANTAMDTDKIKIYGARVRVDSMAKVSALLLLTALLCGL